MKKKISLLLCLISAVLTLSACGEDPKTADYYGTSYDTLKEVAEGYVGQLSALSSDELDMVASSAPNSIALKMVQGWQEATADLGQYQGLGELEVTKANGTVTVDQYAKYSDREVYMSFVWKYDYTEEMLVIEDVNVDKVYTLGEKMSKAGLNTLMGMGTVFTVLILISLIIYSFKLVSNLQNTEKKETAAAETKPAAPAPVLVQEEEDLTDDLELAAVISAAIAASAGVPADGFVVRSIHRR